MIWPAGGGANSNWSGSGGAPALPPNVDPAAMQQAMLWHLQQLAQQQQHWQGAGGGLSNGSPGPGSAFQTVNQRRRHCSASDSQGDTPVTSDSENSALVRCSEYAVYIFHLRDPAVA